MEALIVYLIGAFLTFGQTFHARSARLPDTDMVFEDIVLPSGFAGVAWPVVWLARGAIFITQPRRPHDGHP